MRVLSMIFGIVRSIGRFSGNAQVPLISHIFPPPFNVNGDSSAPCSSRPLL